MAELYKLLSGYEYAELRIEKGEDTRISIKDGELKSMSGSVFGISARVLINGSWGFASSSSDVAPAKLLKEAAALAKLSKGNSSVLGYKAVKYTVSKNGGQLSLEEKLASLKDAYKHAKGKHIANRNINYMGAVTHKEFYNSEGSEIFESQVHEYASCLCISRDGTLIQQGHETTSSTSGFGKLRLVECCEHAADSAERMLKSSKPPAGRFTVILDNEMTGVFSHEALGHATEADSILERESILREKLGKQIGSNLVNIIDDPAAEDFGHYTYDDEGMKAEPVSLIRNGVLTGYLNSRETAAALKLEPNGHARGTAYSNFPIVRMANTYFQPGKSKVQELFDLPYAIYVKGMQGGSVDIFSGSFMFKAEEAYEVKNGSKERLLRDVTLSGNILETLNGVELVADDFGTSPGFCGQLGQSIPVSDGGPHIRVKNMMVG